MSKRSFLFFTCFIALLLFLVIIIVDILIGYAYFECNWDFFVYGIDRLLLMTGWYG